MVEIQSAWFPLIRRNPQKHVPNIFEAAASDSQNARQRICHSKEYPSNAALPVAAR
jgi:predicted acyl esterase